MAPASGTAGTGRIGRAVLALILLAVGAGVAQIPDSGGSSESATASATPTPTPTPAPAPDDSDAVAITFLGTPEGAREVRFNEIDGDAAVARAPLAFRVPKNADGLLDVTFHASADGHAAALTTAPSGLSDEHAVVYAKGLPDRVKAGEIVVLPIRLAIAKGASTAAGDGLLEVTITRENDPDGRIVATGLQELKAGPARVTVTPSPIKLRVTRKWPAPFVDDASLTSHAVTARVTGPGVQALAEAAPLTGWLFSETAGRVGARMAAVETSAQAEPGALDMTVQLDGAESPGKYTGRAIADASDMTPLEIPIEVEVQDAFIWPLSWLFIFAFLGGYLTRRYNQYRRRAILKHTLQRLLDEYRREASSQVYTPPRVFERVKDLTSLKSLDCGKNRLEDQGDIASAYCKIDDAVSDDQFAAVAAEVARLSGLATRWHEVAHSQQQLEAELRAAGLAGSPPARDAEVLLVGARLDPVTDEAARDLVRRMDGQRDVIVAYADLARAYGALDEPKRTRFEACNPVGLYIPEAGRTREMTANLVIALTLARERIDRNDPPSVAPPAEELDLSAIYAALTTVVPEMRRPATPVTVNVTPPAAPPAPAAPVPIRASRQRDALGAVKWWGTLIALATVLLGAVAFLLPKYASHTFGSWEDYLQLACFGFLGSLVTGGLTLNWELFPSLQPWTTATAPKPAPAPPSAPAPVPAPPPAPAPEPEPESEPPPPAENAQTKVDGA